MTEVFGSNGGGNAGHAILDENGTVFPDRGNLKFVNASIIDDETNDVTIIEVEGGGGGGIPLDAPTGVTITNTDEGAILVWTDPADKVVDGTTLASWAGTKIIRKVGSAPTKVTDGTLVLDSKTRNQYSVNGFEDTGLTNGVTYYYGFFPYTTGSVYTYTKTQAFTPEAIYPTAVSDLTATHGYQNATVTFTKPADATGVRLVYSTTEPANETDGTYIDGATSPYTIGNLVNGTKYYIKAYAYNAKNRYIGSAAVEVTPAPVTIEVTAVNEEFVGATVTVTGTTTQTRTFDSTLKLTFELSQTGTYTVTDSYVSSSNTVNATGYQKYSVELSLASIAVNVSESDLYGNAQAKLYSVDGTTLTLISTKTIIGPTTKFSVNTGTYKVAIDNYGSSNLHTIIAPPFDSNDVKSWCESIVVSELTDYNFSPKFAKINFVFSQLLEAFLESQYSIVAYVLLSRRSDYGTNGTYYFMPYIRNDTWSFKLIGENKTKNIYGYLQVDSAGYKDADVTAGSIDLIVGYEYRETSSGDAVSVTKTPNNYDTITVDLDTTGTYTANLDCAKLSITYDTEFVGKYREITFNYTNSSTSEAGQTVWKTRQLITSATEDAYVMPSDVDYYKYTDGTYSIAIYDDDTTTTQTAAQTGIVANSGATVSVNVSATKIYGFHHDFSNLDPATCITYLSGTENENYTPMMTNEGTGTATAGSWATFLTDVLKNKPAMVKTDGTLDYWLDPTDYTKKLDGTASDYNNLNYSGAGAFAWIQKAYMKEVYAAGGNSRDVYFAFGEKPDNTYHAVGFIDGNGELEGVWIPMGYMDANGRTLVAGTTPVASKTCAQEKTIIDSIGSRARFYGGAITNFMRDLMYMLYKHTDIQLRGGHGRCDAGIQQVIANANVTNGNVVGFKGTNDKKTMNKGFHSQLLFSYQQYCRDPYTLLVNGALKYSDNYEYDISGGTYKTAGDTTWRSLNKGWHYGSHLIKSGDNFGSTPKKENNASTTTGLCDGLYCNTSGVLVALRLSNGADDLISGPGCLYLGYEASAAGWRSGVGVLLLPPKGYAPAA